MFEDDLVSFEIKPSHILVTFKNFLKQIKLQGFEDTQVWYNPQKNTLDKYTLEKYTSKSFKIFKISACLKMS